MLRKAVYVVTNGWLYRKDFRLSGALRSIYSSAQISLVSLGILFAYFSYWFAALIVLTILLLLLGFMIAVIEEK